MIDLIRLKNGDFKIEESIPLYDFLKLPIEEMKKKVISVDDYYADLKKVYLNKEEYTKFVNGVKLFMDEPDKMVRVYNVKKYAGLGIIENKELKRFIIENE